MEAGKNSVIYMGLISGPNKADDTCGQTAVTGTMDRGFTVYIMESISDWPGCGNYKSVKVIKLRWLRMCAEFV
jgi:hypothetical protein